MNLIKKLFSALTIASLSTTALAATPKHYISYTQTGQGEPIVLIHAFPTDKDLWKPQQTQLQHYFRIISLDLWGFGQSSATDGQAVTMDQYADEVKELLDKRHIRKAIIGGESMGGYIALAFLEKYPERVRGVILADTQSIADTPETQAKREQTATDVLTNGTATFIQNFLPKALSANASQETKDDLQKILEEQAATGIASASRGMALRHDTSDVLAKTKLPILILTGDNDTLISPQQSQNMHALAKNSKLVTITHSGHLSNLEQPAQWNQAVIDMFSKVKN